MVTNKQLYSQLCGGHCQLHHSPALAGAASPGRRSQPYEKITAGAESHQPDGWSSGAAEGIVGSRSHGCCSCAVSPATMVSTLRGSRYLLPVQELLSEAVSMGEVAVGDGAAARARGNDEALKVDGQFEVGDHAREAANFPYDGKNTGGGGVQAKLLSLLSELESRHEHYFGELSRVAASFEPALGGAGATAGYTALMAQAMSRHFGNLRRAILRKLRLHTTAAARRSALLRLAQNGQVEVENEWSDGDEDDDDEIVNRVVRRTKHAAAAEQAWMPLRGLPEDSVAVRPSSGHGFSTISSTLIRLTTRSSCWQ
ncbi:hypothetical protein GUJ93_ZPchr0003g17009 [Zizania palustris]|uniref:POX domain-containing protein n=1 Tax=Zizania palustris TaxID=103762 RepID=A0A8J5RXI5_ZIZPA|nr:hypothetical protein GUJ93_ZPchr0003g17009 [Zizania palustris]